MFYSAPLFWSWGLSACLC